MRVLTIVDTLRIQDFVFASNRLRDIVAGSALVADAASAPQIAALAKVAPVYAAGGNALLRFEDVAGGNAADSAHGFAARYSRHLIDAVPGLDVEIAHEPYDPGGLSAAFERVGQRLIERKATHVPSAPVLGLSVTAECVQTRAVATTRAPSEGGGEVALSAGMAERRRRGRRLVDAERSGRPNPRFPSSPRPLQFVYPNEIDLLGRSAGDTSLVGVVHVDGNGVGRRIAEWTRARRHLADDDFAGALSKLSQELSLVVNAVWSTLDGRVRDAIVPDQHNPRQPVLHSAALDTGFPLRVDDHSEPYAYLPLRKVLLGGDDLTFVCDGRIALDLARTALETFRDTPVPSLGEALGACSGVAIVRSHAPFARAYHLAESLCAHAKGWLRREEVDHRYAIDWHIGAMGSLESVDDLRRRQYRAGSNELTMRPYALGDASQAYTFAWLDERVLGDATVTPDGKPGDPFQSSFWRQRRNKIKGLRVHAREGPGAVNAALEAWAVTVDIPAGPFELPGTLHNTGGYRGDRTPLIDAIELLDIHLPLRAARP